MPLEYHFNISSKKLKKIFFDQKKKKKCLILAYFKDRIIEI